MPSSKGGLPMRAQRALNQGRKSLPGDQGPTTLRLAPHTPSAGVSLQVYAGEVLYEHAMPPEPFWEAHDTLELRLSSPPAPDVTTTLTVTVSFEAPCPQRASRLWKNEGDRWHELAGLRGWQGAREKGQC